MISAFTALALINLEWNNLPEAMRFLGQGLETSDGGADRVGHLVLRLAQVRLLVTLGDTSGAAAAVALLRTETASGEPPPQFVIRLMALVEADAHLLGQTPSLAIACMNEQLPSPGQLSDRERVTLARSELAMGEPHKAEELLRSVLQNRAADLGTAVEGWLLAALIADRLRQDNAALHAVTRALEIAESEGIRRPFLVLGPRVPALLLRQQHLVGSSADFAADILADLPMESDPAPPPLAEPLTEREFTLLKYLPSMLSNQEIGSDLYISVNTVKAHLKALYRKLGVSSRREAVHRARSLGLL
jgi:LuxR family transcriptional regulator, maltose regulon positive regulatory protein